MFPSCLDEAEDNGMADTGLYTGTVLLLGVVSFIESLAFSLPLSYFPNYAISLGASVASIGLFTSSFMAAMAIMSPKLGGLSDRIGRKRVMMWGLMGDVIFGTLTGLSPSWEWLLLIRTANGAVSAAAMLSAEALLIDHVSMERRGEASGFVMACGMIGRNIGPLFGGSIQFFSSKFISIQNSYRVPYIVDSAFAAFAVLMVFWKLKENGKQKSPKPSFAIQKKNADGDEPASSSLSRSFKILLVLAFANGIGVGFVLPIAALFFQDKFGVEPVVIGSILSLAGFIGLFASWVAGRASDRIGRKPLIGLGGFSARLCGLVIPFVGDLNQATIFFALRSFGFNMFMPALRALRADIVPERVRGRLFGLYYTFFTAGAIVGPIMSAYLYDLYRFAIFNLGGLDVPGFGMPFYVNSVIGLATTVTLLIFVEETRKGPWRNRGKG